MAIGLRKRDPAPAPAAAPTDEKAEELRERWRAQTARVAAAGDVLAHELRALVTIHQEAAAAHPGVRTTDGYVRAAAAGLELPSRLVGVMTGGESADFHGGVFQAWREECRARGWLVD